MRMTTQSQAQEHNELESNLKNWLFFHPEHKKSQDYL